MNGREYIEQCKKKLNFDTDYKLAKYLEISQSDLNFYARGERLPSVYACFKFAECLGLDPAEIIADIASESEKNPKKRAFFKGFMSTCMKAVAGCCLIAALWNTTNDVRALSAS
ncbi:MAG: helix-turn-helix transcriptional regulator [Methylotenera sp.]|nr:helix-turn-helix transcriptional regulator [Methylotenera sp.]